MKSKSKAEDQLLKDFPLAVGHPSLQGQHLMLNWWSHNEQNHLSVAKTEDQLVTIFERVLADQRSDDAKPVAVWAINVVKPPRWLELRTARLRQEQEIDAFKGWVARSALVLAEAGKPLPPAVTRCPLYRPRRADSEPDQWQAERHSDCQDCTDGLRFKLEDFYPRLQQKYRSEMIRFQSGYMKIANASRAPVADPKTPLFEARVTTGHHREGTGLIEIKKNHSGFFQEVLFFCHATKLEMPKRLLDLAIARDAAWRKEQDDRQAEISAERLKNEAEAIANAEAFFKL